MQKYWNSKHDRHHRMNRNNFLDRGDLDGIEDVPASRSVKQKYFKERGVSSNRFEDDPVEEDRNSPEAKKRL